MKALFPAALALIVLSVLHAEDKPKTDPKTATAPVIIKTEDEWKKILTEDQFKVTRQQGTERPFGDIYKEFEKQGEGTYFCICCGAELFTSTEKFHSGCGWPSFYDSSKAKNVLERVDNSHGMRRVETVCKRCGAHLGHVFEGEGFKTPTDRRFCINGVALKFVAKGGQAPKLLEPESAEVQKKKDEVAKEGGEAPRLPKSDTPKSSGTAFAISNQGHLITNAHVIEGAMHLKVKLPEGEQNAKVISVDKVNDLAILKIETATMPLVLDVASVKAGEEILVAGFPNPELQGTSVKLTRGIISSLKGVKDDARHFQIDAAVQPGNSGGPMLNKDGRVVGIIVAKLADAPAIRSTGAIPQNVNYAVKLDYLLPLLKSVDGLWEVVSSQKDHAARTAGEKATASTFLLINDPRPLGGEAPKK